MRGNRDRAKFARNIGLHGDGYFSGNALVTRRQPWIRAGGGDRRIGVGNHWTTGTGAYGLVAVLGLPTKYCIIDGELIAAGAHGQPDFLALLHGRRVPVCVYAFDLMQLQSRDLRDEPLEQRRARLRGLLVQTKGNLLRFSESFPDAGVLLAECARLGIEGVVCKRKESAYRSGTRSGWIKVKTEQRKAANRYRAKLFEK